MTSKINLPVVCLDHGLRNPSSSKPYRMVPATEHIDNPAVIELLQAFGRGELQHGAAQAAAWHLNSDVSWQELAAKQQGTRRSLSRPPFFSEYELRAGMAYASEANRRAEYARLYGEKEKAESTAAQDSDKAAEDERSRIRSESDE